MNFVIRTSIEPDILSAPVRRELQSLDPNQAVFNVRPMTEFLSEAIAQRRFSMLLLGLFAALRDLSRKRYLRRDGLFGGAQDARNRTPRVAPARGPAMCSNSSSGRE